MHVNNNSSTGPLIIGTFEKRAPGELILSFKSRWGAKLKRDACSKRGSERLIPTFTIVNPGGVAKDNNNNDNDNNNKKKRVYRIYSIKLRISKQNCQETPTSLKRSPYPTNVALFEDYKKGLGTTQ